VRLVTNKKKKVMWYRAAIGLLYVLGFCILFIIQILLIGVLENYFTHHRIQSSDPKLKQAHYRHRTPFYHIITPSVPSTTTTTTTTTTVTSNPAIQMEEHFYNKTAFEYMYDGVYVRSGLPVDMMDDDLVVLHVSGGWLGLFPHYANFNHMVSGHARPTHDTIGRYAFLKLPVPIISFRNPTDTVYGLNFGGPDDQLVLSDVLQQLCDRLPKSCDIIVATDCLGGLRFLRWMETYDGPHRNRIVASICESPLNSTNRVFRSSKWKPLNDVFCGLLELSLPNFIADDVTYKPEYNCDVPTIVTLVEGDRFCDSADLEWIRKAFNRIYATIVVPKNQFSSAGRTIGHGHAYRWPPLKHATLQLLHHLRPKTFP
jgi:hypothetical protein